MAGYAFDLMIMGHIWIIYYVYGAGLPQLFEQGSHTLTSASFGYPVRISHQNILFLKRHYSPRTTETVSQSRARLRSPGGRTPKRPKNRNASVSRGTLNFAVPSFYSANVFRGFIVSSSSSLGFVRSKSNLRRKSKQNQESLGFLPLEKMAKAGVLICEEDFHPFSIFDDRKGKHVGSRGSLIEKKIDLLESEANKVSNRRSRRWLNDRLLIELVPRLNADEIRGLFAPPPWGNDTPLSPFCMTNIGEWDAFRNVDMDKEVSMIEDLSSPSTKRKGCIDTDKMAALDAWHRVDCRTRQALRRNFLSDIIEGYEECIRAFVKESEDGDVLMMHVQDPFHRLLLHGVCEFYDLVSVTVTKPKEVKVTRINKKKSGSRVIPNMTMTHFLKMAKDGVTSSSLGK